MTTDLLTPREGAMRTVRERLDELLETVKGGTMDGEQVITKASLQAAFDEPLPPATDHAADLVTPSRVVLSAECPKCGLPATIALLVSTELLVDSTGSTIRLKGKSKAASHTCGQTAMFDPTGQVAFDLTDIIGDEKDSDDTGSE